MTVLRLFCIVYIIAGCSESRSLVDVGSVHQDVLWQYENNFQEHLKDKYISQDTLIYFFDFVNQPFEALYLFQNDTCYYQEINMYCSVCYDLAISHILRDKQYKFKAIDEANYISSKSPHIIMRMKDNANPI